MRRNGWTASVGTSGRNESESVDDFRRNEWTKCVGISSTASRDSEDRPARSSPPAPLGSAPEPATKKDPARPSALRSWHATPGSSPRAPRPACAARRPRKPGPPQSKEWCGSPARPPCFSDGGGFVVNPPVRRSLNHRMDLIRPSDCLAFNAARNVREATRLTSSGRQLTRGARLSGSVSQPPIDHSAAPWPVRHPRSRGQRAHLGEAGTQTRPARSRIA